MQGTPQRCSVSHLRGGLLVHLNRLQMLTKQAHLICQQPPPAALHAAMAHSVQQVRAGGPAFSELLIEVCLWWVWWYHKDRGRRS